VHTLPGYFETVGIAPLRGRVLSWDDLRSESNVAVVNASAAKALFGDREPLGQAFEDSQRRRYTVVGVIADVRHAVADPLEPLTYVIPGLDSTRGLYVFAKTRARDARLLQSLKDDLRSIGTGTPVVTWWEDQISMDNAYRNPRFQALVLGSLAALALGLTALGIFSVVAYLVAARTREMGVRLAIGASPGSLVGLMVKQTLVPVLAGLIGGLFLAKWGSGLAKAQLFEVDTSDPRMLALSAIVVVVAAVAAAYLPARRATRINPTEVLRAE
jgi:putative ABC transport system permease protein